MEKFNEEDVDIPVDHKSNPAVAKLSLHRKLRHHNEHLLCVNAETQSLKLVINVACSEYPMPRN